MTTVRVDRAKCEGFGFCEEALPAVFRLDDDSVLHIDDDAASKAVGALSSAVRVCPVAALHLDSTASDDNG